MYRIYKIITNRIRNLFKKKNMSKQYLETTLLGKIDVVHKWLSFAEAPIFLGIEQNTIIRETFQEDFRNTILNYCNFLEEEYNEYFDALEKNDYEEQLDAVADCIFVINNFTYSLNIKYNADLIKEKILNEETVFNLFRNIYGEICLIRYFAKSSIECNVTNIIESVNQINYLLLKISETISQEDIDEKFRQVALSNFTKYTTNEDVAKKSVDTYEKGNHPTKKGKKIECYYKKVGDLFVIRQKGNNKIMKSIEYKEPLQCK